MSLFTFGLGGSGSGVPVVLSGNAESSVVRSLESNITAAFSSSLRADALDSDIEDTASTLDATQTLTSEVC